jgi:hypothetical protein
MNEGKLISWEHPFGLGEQRYPGSRLNLSIELV